MAKLHFECSKCTNKYCAAGSLYCKPTVDAYMNGRQHGFRWDWHDGSGKNAEAWCDEYTTEPRQMELHPLAAKLGV